MIKTDDWRLWILKGFSLSYGLTEVIADSEANPISRNVILSPHLPYMYLPADDYSKISNQMKILYPDIDCSSSFCKFPNTCQHYNDEPFSMIVGDTSGVRLTLTNPDNSTFIDGEEIGDMSDSCYLPFF